MKKQKLFLICFSVILTGCSHYYYVSSTQNVPMFREKNELHTSGGYAESDETNGWEAHVAYSVTNHIGILTNYMSAKGGSVSGRDFGQGKYMDIAAGYFRPMNRITTLEVYGGIGQSKQYHEYTAWDGYYEGAAKIRFTNIFIQGAYGLCFDNFNVIASARLNQIDYYDFNTSPDASGYLLEDLDNLKGKVHYVVEPALTVRGGWKYLKAQFQVSYAEYLNSSEFKPVDPVHASLCLYFTIAPRYWKNAK